MSYELAITAEDRPIKGDATSTLCYENVCQQQPLKKGLFFLTPGQIFTNEQMALSNIQMGTVNINLRNEAKQKFTLRFKYHINGKTLIHQDYSYTVSPSDESEGMRCLELNDFNLRSKTAITFKKATLKEINEETGGCEKND